MHPPESPISTIRWRLYSGVQKPVILVANKEDIGDARFNIPEFYSLGLGDPVEVSSANGSGTGDLLDKVIEDMPEPKEEEKPEEDVAKFAIVGRPNAGNHLSSMLSLARRGI